MSSNQFTKENLDDYLKELGKQFRKLNGKNMRAEIILIGGAAILSNYGFRESTTDVDAIIRASSVMKDAINYVGDKFNLPNNWLNSDFKNTASYSEKLVEISIPYKTFSNILDIRTISAENLIAMKLVAGRKYKNDYSDIVGILLEHKKENDEISLEKIKKAVIYLFGDLNKIDKDATEFIENLFNDTNFEEIYKNISNDEINSKKLLIEFNKNYPKVTNDSNVDDILNSLKSKKNNSNLDN